MTSVRRLSHNRHMTNMRLVEPSEIPIGIPQLTLGWRMQMAMDHGKRSREYMAKACGVVPATISRWLHDGGVRPPRSGDMEIWARECRVPLEWLYGEGVGGPDDGQVTLANIAPGLSLIMGEAICEPDETPIVRHLAAVPEPVINTEFIRSYA